MADTTLDPRFGNPTPDATHWQIHRMGGAGDELLSFPDPDGVMSTRWPIADLSMALVRERWGAGKYHVRWYTADGDGNRTRGKSPTFEIRSADAPEAPAVVPVDDFGRFQAMQRQAQADARSETDRILSLAMQLGGRAAPATAPAPESEELRSMRAELQEMRTREAARTAADAVRAELRADLEASNRRIAELERESERAEDDGPSLDLESPIMGQVVSLAVNAALKNPDLVTGLLSTIMQKVAEARPNPAPPAASAPPVALPNVSRETSPAPRHPVVVPFPKKPEPNRPAVASVEDYGKPEPIEPPAAAVVVEKADKIATNGATLPAEPS
jgi:hypothetical protein